MFENNSMENKRGYTHQDNCKWKIFSGFNTEDTLMIRKVSKAAKQLFLEKDELEKIAESQKCHQRLLLLQLSTSVNLSVNLSVNSYHMIRL